MDVKSPSAGRVLRVPQESEAVISAGTPIVEVGDPSHVEVVAEFLSQDAVRMKPGARAQIENWGGPPLPARCRSRGARGAHEDLGAGCRRATHERHSSVHGSRDG